MNLKKKTMRVGMVFILLLAAAGVLLLYKGNDAVVLAVEKKEGILTAEQVRVSFDSVSGRLVREMVTEAQVVKKGDPLLVLQAMKMDTLLVAHKNGTVKKLSVKQGDIVPKHHLLVELK